MLSNSGFACVPVRSSGNRAESVQLRCRDGQRSDENVNDRACDQLCDLASELEVTPKVLSQRQGAQLREFADTMNAELENLADIFSHLEDQAEDRDVLWEIACGHLPQLATEGERLAPCTTNPVNYTSEWF